MLLDVRPSALRRGLFGVFFLLTSLAVQAQEEPARFLLEKITVEGTREAAGRIVKAETLLEEGGTYSEAELGQAVARVHRLPFVLDADFSLQKGSTRGSYELLIEVQEARRFFFDHTVGVYVLDRPLHLDDSIGSGNSWSAQLPGLIGFRQFIGRSGVVFAALDSEEGVQAGFTRYDLFGRGIVASVGYSGLLADFCCSSEVLPYGLDPSFVSWSWHDSAWRLSAEVGVPLSPTDALRLGWSRRDGEGGSRREVFGHLPRWSIISPADDVDVTLDRAELKWIRDTSDDPLVPTRGFTLSGGLEWSSFQTGPLRSVELENGEMIERSLPAQTSEQIAAVVSAERHWSLTPRQAVSGLGRLSVGQSSLRNLPTKDGGVADDGLNVFGGAVGLRHAVWLKQSRGTRGFADTYLESRVEYGIESTSPDLRTSSASNPLERLELSTGLVFRNAWGLLRFVLSFLDVGEVVR